SSDLGTFSTRSTGGGDSSQSGGGTTTSSSSATGGQRGESGTRPVRGENGNPTPPVVRRQPSAGQSSQSGSLPPRDGSSRGFPSSSTEHHVHGSLPRRAFP